MASNPRRIRDGLHQALRVRGVGSQAYPRASGASSRRTGSGCHRNPRDTQDMMPNRVKDAAENTAVHLLRGFLDGNHDCKMLQVSLSLSS